MSKEVIKINQSKEHLLAEIERLKKELKKKKKYGLVWEEKPEEVVEMCKEKLPVLKEVKSKEIITDKDKPVNLLIEGDNYHALSVLNYTHPKKIDVIYIDPPYNTGNKDFIFNDRYVDKEDAYRHSKWLAFMEKRLKSAKNLLSNKGVIFISIDDNEQAPLRMLCNEIFGEENFIATVIWQKKFSPQNDAKYFSDNHDFILVCVKKKNYGDEADGWIRNLLPRSELMNARYSNPDNDPRGPWTSGDVSVKTYTPSTDYPITTPSGRVVRPPKGYCWRFSKEKLQELIKDNRILFGENGSNVPRLKRFLSEVQEGLVPLTIWPHAEVGHNQEAKQELKDIVTGSENVFDTPKPIRLIKRILQLGSSKNSIILDFMAGSGTTGHAVLEANKEDGGNRQFILCTNDENNIASGVCYPRIKKVLEGYKNLKGQKVEGLGGNLKYFKTDFVDAEPTDRNKIKLTEQATEMLCVKEGTFESVFVKSMVGKSFKIYKNSNHYTGIIFDQVAISAFKKVIEDIKGKFSIYVFSLGDETFDEEFEDIKQKVKLSSIPEVILRVYRRIFK